MLSMKPKFMRTFSVLTLVLLSCRIYSQTLPVIIEYYDTTSYIPSFYDGALDYNLMIAASKGYSLEIERLIKNGADVNAKSEKGVTPLIFAVANNQTRTVNLLLKFGADVNTITSEAETPLLVAVKNQNTEITEALIRAGADIDMSDKHDATPLHYASIYGYFQLVDLLLYYEASIDKKSVEGTTPLLASIWAGHQYVADLLIQNGADIEASDNEGYTPFMMASFFGDTIVMDLLYKKGTDIYATNNSNHNALTLSILAGQVKATEYLLKIGDKWSNSGRDVVNPYFVASKYGRKDIINILEKDNIKGQINHQIDQVAITAASRFSVNDIYTGISLSFKEPWLNAGFITGYDMKLWYTRILIKSSEHVFYQYFDKGSLAYAGLFKDFSLTERPDRFNYLFSTSILAGYSFGNKLKGTLISPANKLRIIPAITFKMTKMNISFNVGLEYVKTEYYNNGPLWIRIGCSYNYFFDKVRTKVKPIKWY
jgi:ankyrin repeat protein